MPPHRSTVHALLALALSIAVLLSLLVAVAAGLLAWADGASPASTLLTAGTAFAGTLTLLAVLATALRALLT